ncbi:MAG TPA: response regulator transcription factor [Candidatus Binataceae bacterium]|nr:response regulator transcription factor [Candidatus Binataceae bacterium]
MPPAHLLVVEDETRLLDYLRRGLCEEGFAVTGAVSAEAAEAILAHASFAAIVLDLRLPQKNGIQFLCDLRANGDTTPVLILTALDSLSDRVAGLNAGADDYLAKPFALAELVARMRALVRRGMPSPPVVLQVADLAFDTATRRVRRAGHELNLSPKETLLLELLMRNAGNTVTRTMITEVAWSGAYNDFSNLIEVFVNRLRHKIDDGSPSLITTVRGVGYAMRRTR